MDPHSSSPETAHAAAPSGRDARLWRVVLELRAVVDEAAEIEGGNGAAVKPKPLAPVRLERLVVEFDDAYTAFVEGMERLPSEAQLVALQAVDRQLAAMVAAKDASLWTAKALRDDARWGEAGRLARGVIEAFAWPARRLSLVAAEAAAADRGAERSSASGNSPRREA